MMIMVMGLPGTGKTTFANALAERLSFEHINSDEVRADISKMGQYSLEDKRIVYQEMLARTENLIQAGKSVILDATFIREDFRNPFLELAKNSGTQVFLIRISANEGVVEDRLTHPRPLSEADYEVYRQLDKQWESLQLPHLSLYSSLSSLTEMVDQALVHINLILI